MQWSPSDSLALVADLISAIVLIVTIISVRKGLFLTSQQLKMNNEQLKSSNQVQRATFFKELYLMMFADPDIRKAFYLVEFRKFDFKLNITQNIPLSSKIELVDKLLNYVNLLCSLYFRGMLSSEEMNHFRYMLAIIYTNSDIQSYLEFVTARFQKKAAETPWQNFVAYCEKLL